MIRDCNISDAQSIANIYNYYVAHTMVTAEEIEVSCDEMKQRIVDATGKGYPWLVFEQEGIILGYCYAHEFRSRHAYRYTLESSVYVKQDLHHNGIGSQLYRELISRLQGTPYHSLIAVVSASNPTSNKFHQQLGFNLIGVINEGLYKFSRWDAVELWQLILGQANVLPFEQ